MSKLIMEAAGTRLFGRLLRCIEPTTESVPAFPLSVYSVCSVVVRAFEEVSGPRLLFARSTSLLLTTNHRLPITDHRLLITDYSLLLTPTR